MPRHRAPSVPARLLTPALTAAAATGAALSASLFSPTTVEATGPHGGADQQVADQRSADAADPRTAGGHSTNQHAVGGHSSDQPAPSGQPADQDGTDWPPSRSSERHSTHRPGADRLPEGHHRTPMIRLLRPMTSGERQYLNGCRQGYISDNCEQFSVTGLLRHGVNPYR